MLLKRIHHNGRVTGLALGHTGIRAEQNFSADFVAEAVAGGYASIDSTSLLLTVNVGDEDDTLRYSIRRSPGYYSCHDGKRIPISELAQREAMTGVARLAAAEARAWLISHGDAGKTSPDARHTAGYEVLNVYECVLDAEQHARYRLPSDTPSALALSFDSIRARRAAQEV